VNTHSEPDLDCDRARQFRRALASTLSSQGISPRWRDAFERVPRHVFVPQFFLDQAHNGLYELIRGTDPRQHDEWLAAIYSDETLITQLDGSNDTWASDGRPTSSSTMPSLMALMLEALDIHDGMNILEIGTGTGYNAALLCERLGGSKVTTVDIDPLLVNLARQRLLKLGFTPTVQVTDGSNGYAANAPYDRVLATVSLPQIPYTWIEQSRQGGKILVNLYRDLGGGALALLTANGTQAEGHFLPNYGGFMPIRSEQTSDALDLLKAVQGTPGDTRPTTLDGRTLDDPSFGFFAALRIAAKRIEVHGEAGMIKFWLVGRDGSWAYQTTDATAQRITAQGGKRQLWDELEAAHTEWTILGQPPRNNFGLTVTRDGNHRLWLMQPVKRSWQLSPDEDS
jgi:methyltransferase of ATP-grasp peptide maturase system